MRNPLITALILSAFTACSAQPTAEQTPQDPHLAEAWLDKIEQSADNTHSLTADLRYDRNQLLLGDKQRRFGTLIYQAGPPPKFAIHFNKLLIGEHWTQPDLRYIYDGRWLLKRDQENKTAVRYQLLADDEAPADAMALGEGPFPVPLNLKKEKVLQKFDATVIPPTEGDPDNSIHLQLIPHDDHESDLILIDLWFDRDTLLPVGVATLDESENQTLVQLTEIHLNPDLKDQPFDTSLPTEQGWQTDENRLESE